MLIQNLADRFSFFTSSPLKARLTHGAIWGFLASSIARGLALAASFFVARLLGRAGFGEWGIIQSTVAMVGVFSGFGLGLTAIKYVAAYRNQDPLRTGRIIGLSTLIAVTIGSAGAVFFWYFSPWLAEHTLNAPNLASSLRIGTLLLFFNAVDGFQKGTLAGFEEFRLITRIVLWTGILGFPMTLAGVYWGGLNGGIWALALNSFLMWFLNLIAIRKVAKQQGIRISYGDCLQERSILWAFSLPAFLSQSLVIPINWACSAILANQPTGYNELGLFNAANQWRGALLFFPYASGRIILPVMSYLHAASEATKLKRVFRGIIFANLGLGGLGFIAISLLSPFILEGYGPAFRGGEKVVIILAFSALCSIALFVINQFLISTNRIWFSVVSNTLLAMISLGLAIILIPRYGALGLAVSLAVASSCEILWKLGFLKKRSYI